MNEEPQGGRSATQAGNGPRRLENRTLSEQVLDQLREDILSGELVAGEVLGEVALAESFGVSRGPIREALSRLASEGLVTMVPRRGAEVTRLTRQEFLDAYQVREALETLAIRLAVPRFDGGGIERLRALHEEMIEHAERDELQGFFEANRAFHGLLVSTSGNRKLQDLYRLLLGQMGRYLARSLALRGTIEKSITEHAAILAAIEAGDADLAVKLLAEHIEVPQRELAEGRADELFEESGAEGEPAPPPRAG